jgi:alkylation response protein AidB-like acyl-CoA dehydrogenase
MDLKWTDEQIAYRQSIRDFLADAVPPGFASSNLEISEQWRVDLTLALAGKMAERGLLTPHWPREYGGQETTGWQRLILAEEMMAAGEPRGPQYMNVNWIGPAIMMAGTPEQKRYHLDRISRGDVLWCQGFSEPDSGTDLASLRTSAVRDGDHYVVNGEKVWTSYANVAEYCFLLVRTAPSARGSRGITILLVRTDTPGFEIRPIPSVLGAHAIHHLTFTDMRVPVEARLGPENEGWPTVRQALARERVGQPRYARSAANLDRVVTWLRERGGEIPGSIRRDIARARAACEAARVLVYRAVDEQEHGHDRMTISLARVAQIQAERAVGEVAMAAMGLDGIRGASIADRQMRYALTGGLTSGSYELQLNIVATRILGLPSDRAKPAAPAKETAPKETAPKEAS